MAETFEVEVGDVSDGHACLTARRTSIRPHNRPHGLQGKFEKDPDESVTTSAACQSQHQAIHRSPRHDPGDDAEGQAADCGIRSGLTVTLQQEQDHLLPERLTGLSTKTASESTMDRTTRTSTSLK